jgi:hypothetical protein
MLRHSTTQKQSFQQPMSNIASHTMTTNPQATNDGRPIDAAANLKKELDHRVQTEPDLFNFIQKAALDGLWYVLQPHAS